MRFHLTQSHLVKRCRSQVLQAGDPGSINQLLHLTAVVP